MTEYIKKDRDDLFKEVTFDKNSSIFYETVLSSAIVNGKVQKCNEKSKEKSKVKGKQRKESICRYFSLPMDS